MKLAPTDLEQITSTTLGHYNEVAESFREGTRDHDVSQNITAILQHIEGKRPFTILDFGCGPGRDLKVFTELGHIASDWQTRKNRQRASEDFPGCNGHTSFRYFRYTTCG